jgi:hypothetical protein
MGVSAEDREMLAKLYERHRRTTFKGEADNCRDAILKILGRNGLEWDDLHAIIDPCVLDLVEELIARYIWITPRERTAVALWILHTHVYRQFNITPRLAILSPDYECGKTSLLALIQHLVPQPTPTRFLDTTAAGLYQSIESGVSVVLLDEVDNLGLKHNGKLRTILNANRKGEALPRGGSPTKGGGPAKPKLYRPFIPIAVAAVGGLPKALALRSIPIFMKPKPPDIKRLPLKRPRRFKS